MICDRATFSATQIFINNLERTTRAVFVGEPSGSRPRFTGEDAAFFLPNSHLRANVSYVEWTETNSLDHRSWIPVNVPVPLTHRDYAANRDPSMDAIARLISL